MLRLSLFSLVSFFPAGAQALDIYLIDMSACTLVVTPQREAILIDAGHKMLEKRDVGRIHKVVTEVAGLERIDHFVVTHFHIDHYGAVLLLSQTLPILNFYDHALLSELEEDPKEFRTLYPEYLEASQGRRRSLRPGDEIALKQGSVPLKVRCIGSDRKTLPHEGEQNLECSKLERRADNSSEDSKSVVLLVEYGDFKFLHTGDLPWNDEANLVCPTNLVGKVDFFQTSAHGKKLSNSPLLLSSVEPTVAWMNNAPGKGGDTEVVARLKALPGCRDVYQLHLNSRAPEQKNAPLELIANLGPREGCPGHWLRLSVEHDGKSFSVTNSRNDLTRHYPVRSRPQRPAATSGAPRTDKPSGVPMTRPEECLAVVDGMGGQGTFVELANGGILFSRSDGRSTKVGGHFATSADGGLTWSEFWRGRDVDGSPLGRVPGSLARLSGGAIGYAARSRAGRGMDSAILFWRSEDDGKTWSRPVRVSAPALHGVSVSNDVFLRTSSGRLLLPVYGYWARARDPGWGAARSRRTVGGLRKNQWVYAGEHPFDPAFSWSYVYYSDNEGRTWESSRGGMIFIWDSETMTHQSTTEPTAVEVEPGKILMFLRTMTGRLYKAWSFDDGQTWMAPTPTPLAASNASAKLKKIPGTDDLLVVWNQQSEEEIRKGLLRSRLSTAVSRTNGAIWEFFQNVAAVVEGTRVEPGPVRSVRPEGLVHAPTLPAPVRDPRYVVDFPDAYSLSGMSHPAVFFYKDRMLISYGRYGNGPGTLKVLPTSWLYAGPENMRPRKELKKRFPIKER